MVEEEHAHRSLQLMRIFNLNPGAWLSTEKEGECAGLAGLPNTWHPHAVALPPLQEGSDFLLGLTPAWCLWGCCQLVAYWCTRSAGACLQFRPKGAWSGLALHRDAAVS